MVKSARPLATLLCDEWRSPSFRIGCDGTPDRAIDDGRGEGTRAAPSINRREHVVQYLMTVIACYTISNECVCVYQ